MGGGSNKTETVTKQDNTPWAPAQQPLQDIYSAAGTAYDATPKTAYAGSYIAPQSQATTLAQMFGKQLAGQSMGQGNPVTSNANNIYDMFSQSLAGANKTASNAGTVAAPTVTPGKVAAGGVSGDFANYVNDYVNRSGNNGALQKAIGAANDPIMQQLLESIIPQAKLNAVGSNTYGGDAGDINMSKSITDNFTRTALNNADQLTYQDLTHRGDQGVSAAQSYFDRILQGDTTNAGLDLQGQTTNATNALDASKTNADLNLRGASLIPGLTSASTDLNKSFADSIQSAFNLNALPIDTMNTVGAQEDKYQQDMIAALYKQWQDQVAAPFTGLEQYRGAISGYPTNSSGSGTSNTTGGGGLF